MSRTPPRKGKQTRLTQTDLKYLAHMEEQKAQREREAIEKHKKKPE